MPATIRAFCHRSGQAEPQSNGEIVRCCLESLALKYRWVIEALAALTDRNIETLRVVGGGSQNALLCQFTADACGRSVIAGPAECTALGNMLVQAIATGYIGGEFRSQKSEVRSGSVAAHALAAGRQALAASVTQRVYTPQPGAWDAAFARFATLLH
jgi:rhamnulokinase